MRSERLYLEDILQSVQFIREFTAGGRDEFLGSVLIQDAVLRRFEIIGTAVKAISEQRLETHPDVAWTDVMRFRDFIAHHYWYIDVARVWLTIQEDLAPLEAAIRVELAMLPD